MLCKVLERRVAVILFSAALLAFGAYHFLDPGSENQRPRRDNCLDRLQASLEKLNQIRTMLREDGLGAIGRFRVNDYWQVDGLWTVRGRGRVPEEEVLRSAGIEFRRYQSYCALLNEVSGRWARGSIQNGDGDTETEVIVYEGGIVGSSQVISFVCAQKTFDLTAGVDDVMELDPGQEAYVGTVGDWYVKFSR